MARTLFNSDQIEPAAILRSHLNTSTAGSAVIAKVIAGNAISLAQTGADTGTGDVTLGVGTFPTEPQVAAYPSSNPMSSSKGVLAGLMLQPCGSLSVSTAGAISWTARIIVMGLGNDPTFSTSGYFDITMPPNGTVIPGLYGAASTTVANGAIPLTSAWQTLWYALPIGGPNTTVAGNFYTTVYTSSSTPVVVPPNFVPICTFNNDALNYRWLGNRYTLNPGDTIDFTKFRDGIVTPNGMFSVAGDAGLGAWGGSQFVAGGGGPRSTGSGAGGLAIGWVGSASRGYVTCLAPGYSWFPITFGAQAFDFQVNLTGNGLHIDTSSNTTVDNILKIKQAGAAWNTAAGLDLSGMTAVSIASGGTLNLPASVTGLLLLTETTTNTTAAFLLGGQSVMLLGASNQSSTGAVLKFEASASPDSGALGLYWNSSSSVYTLTNNTGAAISVNGFLMRMSTGS